MRPLSIEDNVVSNLEETMETVSIVTALVLGFALSNLVEQVLATAWGHRVSPVVGTVRPFVSENPVHARMKVNARIHTDRIDLQRAIGHDFAEADIEDRIWPRDPVR